MVRQMQLSVFDSPNQLMAKRAKERIGTIKWQVERLYALHPQLWNEPNYVMLHNLYQAHYKDVRHKEATVERAARKIEQEQPQKITNAKKLQRKHILEAVNRQTWGQRW